MAIRRLYTRQDGKWAWELVVDGKVVATDGGEGYADEAEAREIVNRIIRGEFSDAEKRIRRVPATAQKAPQDSANESAADKTQEKQPAAKKTPDKKAPAKKTAAKKPTQKPGSPASTSGQYQPKRGGSEVTVPKGHRLPPGPRKGEKWVNVDPSKNKSGKKAAARKETSSSRNSATSTRAIRGAFTTADVRAWAKRNGYVVSDRGRVPKHISGAYRAAHRS
ncbi:Lsr2 family DNA-binding protein [Arthrobacter monumenti]